MLDMRLGPDQALKIDVRLDSKDSKFGKFYISVKLDSHRRQTAGYPYLVSMKID